MYVCMYITAYALGDSSVTLEQVTPAVFPAGELFPSEVAFLFEDSVLFSLCFFFSFCFVFLISYFYILKLSMAGQLICVYLAGKNCETV